MKIATWNVNSLRVRENHVKDWLAQHQPDVLAIQETKVVDDDFPRASFETAGYRSVFSGQRTYNGVALLSRKPAMDTVTDPPQLADDPQKRVIAASFDGVRIVNLYVPNGSEVGSEKYAYKLDWLERIHSFIAEALRRWPLLAVVGDFNIAPDDRDVHDPDAWREKILCSTPERQALGKLLSLPLIDAYREFETGGGHFSWWDYRAAGFRRNLGLRIDLMLISERLKELLTACDIDVQPRALERPSDHAPVWAEFAGEPARAG